MDEEERKKKSGLAPTVAPPAKFGILGLKKGGSASSRTKKATVKPKSSVVKTLKKAGFYDASKPKRLGIINKVTTKPERIEMVDKLFLAKKVKGGKL
jgi:hypothetical protein